MLIMLKLRNHITFWQMRTRRSGVGWLDLLPCIKTYAQNSVHITKWVWICKYLVQHIVLSTSNYPPVASWSLSHVSEQSPPQRQAGNLEHPCLLVDTPRNWDAGVPCAQKGKGGIVHSLLLLAFHPATPRNSDHSISEVVRWVVVAGWYQYVYWILLQGSCVCTNSSCDGVEWSIW